MTFLVHDPALELRLDTRPFAVPAAGAANPLPTPCSFVSNAGANPLPIPHVRLDLAGAAR